MRNTQQVRKPLSALESKVMQIVWAHTAVSAEQVREGLEREHPLKEATIRTLLRRLEEKGYVMHEVQGRTYIYRGLQKPESVAVHGIRQLLHRFCGGSVEQLLLGMVEEKVISANELSELARRISARRKKV
jgi:predicted transcriptional regulator